MLTLILRFITIFILVVCIHGAIAMMIEWNHWYCVHVNHNEVLRGRFYEPRWKKLPTILVIFKTLSAIVHLVIQFFWDEKWSFLVGKWGDDSFGTFFTRVSSFPVFHFYPWFSVCFWFLCFTEVYFTFKRLTYVTIQIIADYLCVGIVALIGCPLFFFSFRFIWFHYTVTCYRYCCSNYYCSAWPLGTSLCVCVCSMISYYLT